MKKGIVVIVLTGAVLVGGISFGIISNIKSQREIKRTDQLIRDANEVIKREEERLIELRRKVWNINKEIHETERAIKKSH